MVGRPRDAERRRPLRPLSRLDAGAGAARRLAAAWAPVPVAAAGGRRRSPSSTFYTWNVARAAHRPDVRSFRRRQDRAEGQLRPLLAQPWRRASAATAIRTPPARTPPTRGTTSTAIAAGSQVKKARQTAAALEGAIGVDPNIKAPYSHEAAAWIERQLSDTMGVRAGFVYKTEDDLIATMQPGSAGVGVHGAVLLHRHRRRRPCRHRATTASLTLLRHADAPAAHFPTDQVVMNCRQFSRYKTVEVSMNKRYGNRWSGSDRASATRWMTDFPNGPQRNPNKPGRRRPHAVELQGVGHRTTRRGGVRISPVLRHQSGANYARTVTITGAGGARPGRDLDTAAGTTAYVEPMDANREDNIWVFDVRAEKSLSFTDRIRLRAYFDLFNITNSHASETHHARDRAELPEAGGHPRPDHGAGSASASSVTRRLELDSCGGVVRVGGATPAPPPFFVGWGPTAGTARPRWMTLHPAVVAYRPLLPVIVSPFVCLSVRFALLG